MGANAASGVDVPSPIQQYLARLVKLRNRSHKRPRNPRKRKKGAAKKQNNVSSNGGSSSSSSSKKREQAAATVDMGSIERLMPRLGAAVAEACELSVAPGNLDALAAAWPAVRGAALFPVLSFVNHDCDPNSEIVFRGPDNTASLVSMCPLEAGEELTISYIDNCWSDSDEDDDDDTGIINNQLNDSRRAEHPPWHWRSRHDALLSRYGFACTCRRCQDEQQHEVSRKQQQSKKEKS